MAHSRRRFSTVMMRLSVMVVATLTGLIAALLAQGSSALEAASLGAYLHGLSGDLGRDELGEWGLTAADIVTHLPQSFLETRRVSVRAG